MLVINMSMFEFKLFLLEWNLLWQILKVIKIKKLIFSIDKIKLLLDNVGTLWSACLTNSACNPSFSLQCNLTGQYTNVNNNRLKDGTCVCPPYYYWTGGTTGCTAQLTYNSACSNANPSTFQSQCLDQTDLYCDSTSWTCICSTGYYWSYTNTKCCIYLFVF